MANQADELRKALEARKKMEETAKKIAKEIANERSKVGQAKPA